MCYPVCGMVHVKEPLLLIGVAHVAAVGFLSLYELLLSCLMPYNRKQNVLSVSLNKTFPSLFLLN